MKRSEKIEVRLSHEEKQSLSRIAEGEGRTVSDLVRGLIERYVTLNTARLPQKRRWVLWTALVLGGLLLGHLGTWGFIQLHNQNETPIKAEFMSFGVYRLSTVFSQTTSDGKMTQQFLEVPLLVKDGAVQEHKIEREGNDFIVSSTVTMSEDNLPIVKFDICEIIIRDCVYIADPKLTLAPEESASLMLMTDQQYMIGLEVEPSSTKVELKSYSHTRGAVAVEVEVPE